MRLKKFFLILTIILLVSSLIVVGVKDKVKEDKVKVHYKTTGEYKNIESIVSDIIVFKEELKLNKCLEKKYVDECYKKTSKYNLTIE